MLRADMRPPVERAASSQGICHASARPYASPPAGTVPPQRLFQPVASAGWSPQDYHGVRGSEAPLPPNAALPQVQVKLPRREFEGARAYRPASMRDSVFTESELCAHPDGSLAPSPQVAEKLWYNTYLYVPEVHSHGERKFFDRFVQGPDGDWIDVCRSKRMVDYLQDTRAASIAAGVERSEILSESAVEQTDYRDAYTGEPLVVCRGELLPRRELLERYNIGETFMAEPFFDFSNLRLQWPFRDFDRNKKLPPALYDRLEPGSAYAPNDRTCEFVELPSGYVDRDLCDPLGKHLAAQNGPAVSAQRLRELSAGTHNAILFET